MSQITVLTGPDRHRRLREDERQQTLAAAFASGASIADVARQYDVANSLIFNQCADDRYFIRRCDMPLRRWRLLQFL